MPTLEMQGGSPGHRRTWEGRHLGWRPGTQETGGMKGDPTWRPRPMTARGLVVGGRPLPSPTALMSPPSGHVSQLWRTGETAKVNYSDIHNRAGGGVLVPEYPLTVAEENETVLGA
jgi:hypothetical protein